MDWSRLSRVKKLHRRIISKTEEKTSLAIVVDTGHSLLVSAQVAELLSVKVKHEDIPLKVAIPEATPIIDEVHAHHRLLQLHIQDPLCFWLFLTKATGDMPSLQGAVLEGNEEDVVLVRPLHVHDLS